jgi:nitrilase
LPARRTSHQIIPSLFPILLLNTTCRASIVQYPPAFLDLNASVDRACAHIRDAARGGAQLVVFPETWLPGYPVWLDEAPGAGLWGEAGPKRLYQALVENALSLPGPALYRLLGAAKDANAYVVIGAHERLGGTLYNSMVYLAPDGVTWSVHRKLIPTYTERLVWGQGDGSTMSVVATPFGALGGLICWEHWMPLARAAMHAQHEAIHVAQWPTVHELHQVASRHYAFEGQCFVLAAGTVLSRQDAIDGATRAGVTDPASTRMLEGMRGGNDTLLLRGGSAIIAPSADYLAGPVFDRTAILYADLDPALIAQGHLVLDSAGHYSRPDVFRLEVDTRPRRDVTFG